MLGLAFFWYEIKFGFDMEDVSTCCLLLGLQVVSESESEKTGRCLFKLRAFWLVLSVDALWAGFNLWRQGICWVQELYEYKIITAHGTVLYFKKGGTK
jgi:hypothetical protein